MTCSATPIPGIQFFESTIFEDHRGQFQRVFDQTLWAPPHSQIFQVNLATTTQKGTVRGLHLQMGSTPEYKSIRCIHGKLWDVVVDLRQDSPTFLHWQAFELDNPSQILIIPPGLAHGYQALSDQIQMLYSHTSPYEPNYEMVFNTQDPTFNIKWPIEITDISDKDKSAPHISNDFKGLAINIKI